MGEYDQEISLRKFEGASDRLVNRFCLFSSRAMPGKCRVELCQEDSKGTTHSRLLQFGK